MITKWIWMPHLLHPIAEVKKRMTLPGCENHWISKREKLHRRRRYNSGSMILAMENAGQLIEDEELTCADQRQAGSEPVRPGRRS